MNKDQEKSAEEKRKEIKREQKIDQELEDTFPASDPPSYSQPGNTYQEDSGKTEEDRDGLTEEDDDPTLYSQPDSLYKHEVKSERQNRLDRQTDADLHEGEHPDESKRRNAHRSKNREDL